ncbi:MAG: peptidylprolyl isomerase [Gemmatimonadales bacterium]|nr:peptidylprolyl isomerase [Gemmatimonadales bacterium]
MQFPRLSGLVVGLLVAGAGTLAAQGAGPANGGVVDRVAAVVGTRAIMASQVEEALYQRYPQGLPTDSTQLRALAREVLESLIDDELMVIEAERDTTIRVTPEDVQSAVDETFRATRARFPTEAAFRAEIQIAGFATPEEYRAWLAQDQRRALLIQSLEANRSQDGLIKQVTPTEAEMRALFEREKGNLQPRPPLFSFRQVLVAPKPTPAAKAITMALADSIVRELRAGADFATAARRFSQDPGSAQQGGELDWFRRGEMVTEFERVAFAFRPGYISDPVESPFGIHIIQVQRTQPAEVKARHILLWPTISPAQADSARALAERIMVALRNGASLDSIQRIHHDGTAPGVSNQIPETNIPAPYKTAMSSVEAGQLAPLITLPAEDSTRTKYAIVQVTAKTPGGEPRYEDVEGDLRRTLARRIGIRRYIDKLREATHIEVREP